MSKNILRMYRNSKYRLEGKGRTYRLCAVYGKYNTTALDKIKLDMYYIINYSNT